MNIAKISTSYNVTLGNSIPKSAWTPVTSSVVNVNVSTSQALFVVRVNDDGFWGFFYTPTGDSTYAIYQGSVYCLFTKPSGFNTSSCCIALFSPVFTDPVLIINGAESYGSYPNVAQQMSYFKFDIRPYFDQ